MTRTLPLLTALAAVTFLTGCGIDGPPHRPAEATEPGVTINGDARIGVKYDSNI